MISKKQMETFDDFEFVLEYILSLHDVEIEFRPSSEFATKTNMAKTNIKTGVIHINKVILNKSLLDLCHILAHEMRHIWQYQNGKLTLEYMNNRYKTSDKIDVKAYNMQEPELDANAFANVTMRVLFGSAPLWNGFDDELKSLIRKRSAEMQDWYIEQVIKFKEVYNHD